VPTTKVFLLCWKYIEVMLDNGFIFLIETIRMKLKSPLLSLSKITIYPSYDTLNIIFWLLISSASTVITFSLCLYRFFTNTPFYNFLNKRLPSMSPITANLTPTKISKAVIYPEAWFRRVLEIFPASKFQEIMWFFIGQ
jgi:hypothetical protein